MAGTFINPYTFIPIEEKGIKKDFSEYLIDNNLTGKLECKIVTKTPISIPDEPIDNKIIHKNYPPDHKVYPFLKVSKKAVIPGSSLKGLIRSSFEALTNSCMHTNDDYFYSSGSIKQPGILKKQDGKYILFEAKRYRDKKQKDGKRFTDNTNPNTNKAYKTGDKVRFDSVEGKQRACGIVTRIGESCIREGILLKMNTFVTNKGESNYSIFEKREINDNNVDKKFIDRLEENVRMYVKNDKQEKRGEEYSDCFKEIENGKEIPVWYKKEHNNFYFAPAQMSRTVYVKKPSDFLKERKLNKCENKKELCEACALFGFIKGDKSEGNSGMASRIRFSDAICSDENAFDGYHELPVLASPRLSSFEFYLKNPGNQYTSDTEGTTLAGRKPYWHKNDFNYKTLSENLPDSKNKKMNATVETVKKGTEFYTEIFFNNITENELRKLIFSLNLGENDIKSNQCHKIGHGKPVGLGSAKIIVENVKLRKFADLKYEVLTQNDFLDNSTESFFNNVDKLKKNVLKVSDINAVEGDLISYPQTEYSNEIFKWFSDNREPFKNNGPILYRNKLPSLSSMSQEIAKNPKNANVKVNSTKTGNNQKSSNFNYNYNPRFINGKYECKCSKCGNNELLNPSQLDFLKKQNKRVICKKCRQKPK